MESVNQLFDSLATKLRTVDNDIRNELLNRYILPFIL